jgi:hypothetical protein
MNKQEIKITIVNGKEYTIIEDLDHFHFCMDADPEFQDLDNGMFNFTSFSKKEGGEIFFNRNNVATAEYENI